MAAKPAKATTDDDDSAEDQHDVAAEAPSSPPPREVSVPAKASCLTFVFLLFAVFITLVIYSLRPGSLPLVLTWKWFLVVTILVLVIPIVVYRAVALWMFDEISRFPDIASAWRAGISELHRQGVAISSTPLFLIIGTGNDKLRRNFMNAAEGGFVVDAGSDAAAPLYWYGNNDGIFLYLNDASWMNAAVTLYEIQTAALKSGHPLPGDVSHASAGAQKAARALGTLMPNVRLPLAPQQSRGAALPPDASSQPPQNRAEPAPTEGQPEGAQYSGTLTPGQVMASPNPSAAGQQASTPTSSARYPTAASKRVSSRLTSQQSGLQIQRLENVCGMLRRLRHPVCPANGILTLLPFEMLKAGDQDVAELERAITADLTTIYRELQLRCPVTAVVVGMEQERGFRELIRRIGRDGAVKQRFGQRFDIRSHATVEELRKFTSHVCGTFEDWVYTLFREEEALSHPGNTALYALLCKVRRTMKTRLGDVLGKGFGYDRQGNSLPVLFSGCYFAATGPKADRQAFVSGLLSKLYDEQEDVEWTEDAVRDNRRRGWWTTIGWCVSGALLLLLAGGYAWNHLFG